MDVEAPHRARLLEAISLMPGASTRAIADMVGMPETTACYHLRKLAKAGAITTQVVGRDRCWFRASCGYCPVLRRALPVLRRPGVGEVAGALAATPRSVPELALASGVPDGATRWAAMELERTLLAERTPRGRLALREGAELCLAAARERRTCSLWGSCKMGEAWRARLAGGEAPAHTVK